MNTTYKNPIHIGADPFILLHEDKYYLYATNCMDEGYLVSVSDNLCDWEEMGFCLKKQDVIGENRFWAPEVMYHNGKFYMAYSSEQHLGIAVSDSPLGPFTQKEKKWATGVGAIDGHFFKDDDGTIYLFYVRQLNGNQIFVAKLNDNLTEIIEETEKLIINPEEEWEVREKARTAEGPFVLKHEGKYYLSYSVNDYRSIYYSIGCAVSEHPMGPYKKLRGNPILCKNDNVNGTGHHSFTTSKDGKELVCVYHTHNTLTSVEPRMTCIDKAEFTVNEYGETIIKIYGPSCK